MDRDKRYVKQCLENIVKKQSNASAVKRFNRLLTKSGNFNKFPYRVTCFFFSESWRFFGLGAKVAGCGRCWTDLHHESHRSPELGRKAGARRHSRCTTSCLWLSLLLLQKLLLGCGRWRRLNTHCGGSNSDASGGLATRCGYRKGGRRRRRSRNGRRHSYPRSFTLHRQSCISFSRYQPVISTSYDTHTYSSTLLLFLLLSNPLCSP